MTFFLPPCRLIRMEKDHQNKQEHSWSDHLGFIAIAVNISGSHWVTVMCDGNSNAFLLDSLHGAWTDRLRAFAKFVRTPFSPYLTNYFYPDLRFPWNSSTFGRPMEHP